MVFVSINLDKDEYEYGSFSTPIVFISTNKLSLISVFSDISISSFNILILFSIHLDSYIIGSKSGYFFSNILTKRPANALASSSFFPPMFGP